VKRKLFCPSSVLGGHPEAHLSSAVHVYTQGIKTALWGKGRLEVRAQINFGSIWVQKGQVVGGKEGRCTAALKAYNKKKKLKGRCGTVSVAQDQCLNFSRAK